ncbi:MAG: Ribosomal prokaryotic protein [Anaerocolumna sp.]|nr:Ribosomal prokaryotic protein [Anaerocolumna sp.]
MYAIIATGGKQYKVAEGDIIKGISCWKSYSSECNCYCNSSRRRQKQKSYCLSLQEKDWISQKERSQTAIY